jgi:hypothetical protein
MKIVIHNAGSSELYVAVQHGGCVGALRDGRMQCWKAEIAPGKQAVYVPGDFVQHFDTYAAVIGAVVGVAVGVALIATGAGAPAGAAEGTEAAVELTEIAGAASESSAAAAVDSEAIAAAASEQRVAAAAAQAGITRAQAIAMAKVVGSHAVGLFVGEVIGHMTSGFNLYACPTSQARTLAGDPKQMWHANYVMMSGGDLYWVIDNRDFGNPKSWIPWHV